MKTIREKSLEFFLLLTLLLVILGLWINSPWPLYVSLATGAVALISAKAASFAYRGWDMMARGLAWVMTRIILSLVFFLVLFPVSLLYRMKRKDPLKLRPGRYHSLFEERSVEFSPADLENMW